MSSQDVLSGVLSPDSMNDDLEFDLFATAAKNQIEINVNLI